MKENLEKLRKIQRETAKRVLVEDQFDSPITAVAGADLAFLGDEGVAACVVMDYPPTRVIESRNLVTPITLPYIPTFLTFREGPPIARVISALRTEVHVFLINGQGIAHPVRCGLASHVGVETGKPTIGVTATRLVGDYDHHLKHEGEAVPLMHESQQAGWVLMSHQGMGPIFVSPGHKVGLQSSLEVVRKCLSGHKLPEPLRLAHIAANQEKRSLSATRTSLGHR